MPDQSGATPPSLGRDVAGYCFAPVSTTMIAAATIDILIPITTGAASGIAIAIAIAITSARNRRMWVECEG